MAVVDGDAGNNVLFGSLLADTISGFGGDDWLLGSQGNDTINGGQGKDTVWYTGAGTYFPGAVDAISAGVVINLGAGFARGGAGTDVLISIERAVGSDFDDLIIGSTGKNYLGGAKGANTYDGGPSDDIIDDSDIDATDGTIAYWSAIASVSIDLAAGTATGGGGADTLLGVENAIGSKFSDFINGTSGNNSLDGGRRNDKIDGREGNDDIRGGSGRDLLTGGDGEDSFIFSSIADTVAGYQNDIITDLVQGSDIIDLTGIDAIEGNKDDGFTFIGKATFSQVPGELRYGTYVSQTRIAGDIDGDGIADFQIQLRGRFNLTIDDFLL
ncbi:hypothetical protein [Aestuariivirga sp.]|uniref:calcium-binding protein n=1 Tax=Aestuariivirga sp. TaxID=2650926 RepID=UPI003592F31A